VLKASEPLQRRKKSWDANLMVKFEIDISAVCVGVAAAGLGLAAYLLLHPPTTVQPAPIPTESVPAHTRLQPQHLPPLPTLAATAASSLPLPPPFDEPSHPPPQQRFKPAMGPGTVRANVTHTADEGDGSIAADAAAEQAKHPLPTTITFLGTGCSTGTPMLRCILQPERGCTVCPTAHAGQSPRFCRTQVVFV
jgi:hypothetical protein